MSRGRITKREFQQSGALVKPTPDHLPCNAESSHASGGIVRLLLEDQERSPNLQKQPDCTWFMKTNTRLSGIQGPCRSACLAPLAAPCVDKAAAQILALTVLPYIYIYIFNIYLCIFIFINIFLNLKKRFEVHLRYLIL